MSAYLFAVTIGPVQEFIAAARRSRDLWFGSWLLSELAKAAAKTIADQAGIESLVFPAPPDLAALDARSSFNVANKIVAVVTQGPAAADVGTLAEDAVRHRLLEVWEPIASKCTHVWNGTGNLRYADLASEQINELAEVNWVAIPSTDLEAYPTERTRLEYLLAARKTTRTFGPSPATPDDRFPKSSIDGMRESVIPEHFYANRGTSPQERKRHAQSLFDHFGAGQAERLSGVDLLKRHGVIGTAEADFPSTSHFAALPLLKRLHDAGNDLTSGLDTYVGVLRRLAPSHAIPRLDKRFHKHSFIDGYDASLLFRERLVDMIDVDDLVKAEQALATYFEAASGSMSMQPEPYYAILHADGDRMGVVLDGQSTPEAHRKVSQALTSFAANARSLIEDADHRGAAVYTGGDDVLAFLPLDTALACAKALHDAYGEALGPFKAQDAQQHEIVSTLSVGIAIVHHIEPLSDALGLARGAEKAAKGVEGKNGLAITLSKRSGADRTVAGSWAGSFFDQLTSFVEAHRCEAVPDSAAYDLQNLVQRVGRTLPPPALKAEVLRIIGRKRGLRGQAQQANNDLIATAQKLPEDRDGARTWNVAQFADELIVARAFARALGPKDKEQLA